MHRISSRAIRTKRTPFNSKTGRTELPRSDPSSSPENQEETHRREFESPPGYQKPRLEHAGPPA